MLVLVPDSSLSICSLSWLVSVFLPTSSESLEGRKQRNLAGKDDSGGTNHRQVKLARETIRELMKIRVHHCMLVVYMIVSERNVGIYDQQSNLKSFDNENANWSW